MCAALSPAGRRAGDDPSCCLSIPGMLIQHPRELRTIVQNCTDQLPLM